MILGLFKKESPVAIINDGFIQFYDYQIRVDKQDE